MGGSSPAAANTGQANIIWRMCVLERGAIGKENLNQMACKHTVNHCIITRTSQPTSSLKRNPLRISYPTRAKNNQKTHLSVIGSTRREQCLERVVTRDEETSKVNQELAGDVEEDQEEVDTDQTQDRIHLGDVGLALQVAQDGVLGKL